MRQAFVYLTLKCNNHCKMCYMHEHYSKKMEMDYEDVRKLLVKMKKDNVQKITFLGGEPTLYSRLKEVLLYTKELEFPFVRIQTNGQFGKEFLHDHVIQECVDAFTFSLDGHTEELNSFMRDGSDFDLAVSNIRASLELGKKIAVNITVSHINIDYLEEIIDYIRSLGVKHVYLNLMFDTQNNVTSESEAQMVSSKWMQLHSRIMEKYKGEDVRIKYPVGYSTDICQDNKCLAFTPDRIYIMPNMDRYPCILFVDNPIYKMEMDSWAPPKYINSFSKEQCDKSCFFLKDKYGDLNPMCLYYKNEVGAIERDGTCDTNN